MPSIIEKRVAAGARYAAAVAELRAATIELAAYDQVTREPTFGRFYDPIPLRHPIFAPDVTNIWAADVAAVVHKIAA